MYTDFPTAVLVADLGYGDAGKGSVIDYLARLTGAHTVIRYNGGAQAAHNVITPEGRHHTFAQFGSATLLPGVRTHLSRFMLLHPLAMLAEERHLQSLGIGDAFARTTIDPGALIITPFQQAANRLKEIARGEARHGSCGLGIGETQADALAHGAQALRAADLGDRPTVIRKLGWIRDAKIAQLDDILRQPARDASDAKERALLHDPHIIDITADLFQHFASLVQILSHGELAARLNQPGVTLFEGAQGVLLDEWWGFYPYNSWSTLTFNNAAVLLSEAGFQGETWKLGLARAYATRHGAGPFVTEDPELTTRIPDDHNRDNPWQRNFRAGPLDLLALRYALQVTGAVDGLGITNLDRLEKLPDWRICEAYHYPGDPRELEGFFEHHGSRVTAICVPLDPTDLPRQEKLTRLLLTMRPIYTSCIHDRAAYLELISQKLGLPVTLTSWGPTAREKAILQAERIPLSKVEASSATTTESSANPPAFSDNKPLKYCHPPVPPKPGSPSLHPVHHPG